MSDFKAPYSFPHIGPLLIDRFNGDLDAVENFVNGDLDSTNMRPDVIDSAHIAAGEINGLHFGDQVVIASKLSTASPIEKESISAESIGALLTSGAAAASGNIRSLFVGTGNTYKMRIITGRAPASTLITFNTSGLTQLYQIAGPYDWADICSNGANLLFSSTPSLIIPDLTIWSESAPPKKVSVTAYPTTTQVTFGVYLELQFLNLSNLTGYIDFTIIDIGGY